MTIVATPQLLMPSIALLGPGNTIDATLTLDASGEKACLMFYATKAGNISSIRWEIALTTTGAAIDVRVETISGGYPSGTLWATNTNGSVTTIASDDQVEKTTALTASATVAVGDKVAVVIVQSTGSMTVRCTNASNTANNRYLMPRTAIYTTSWASSTTLMQCYLVYDDGDVIPAHPFSQGYALTPEGLFDSADTPDEKGNLFQVPVPCRIVGYNAFLLLEAGTTGDIVLYDSSNTALATASYSTTEHLTTSNGTTTGIFPSPVDLSANTNYRIVVKPTHAANRTNVYYVRRTANAEQAFFGEQIRKTSRTDAGAWTEDTGRIIALIPVFGGFDDGAGSGGGMIVHPGMTGGMNG